MKTLYRLILTSSIIATLFVSGCKDDNYLTDGGVYNNQTSLSNYDYLKSSGKFDTLILLVDHFELKDSLNKAATFFAFSDYTATVFMRSYDITSIDQLYETVTSKFVTQYMFPTKISLVDVSLQPVIFKNWAEPDSTNCALSKSQYTETVYLTSSAATFKYYQMQYLKVNGEIDNLDSPDPEDPSDVTLRCQTSDIGTSFGTTTLHVFSNNVLLRLL